MTSGKGYLAFVMDQLSGLDGVSYRAMMGEYVLYYRGRVVGGIYDDRLLVKNVPAARALLPDARLELPYEGGTEMLSADPEDRELLEKVFNALAKALPPPKEKKK